MKLLVISAAYPPMQCGEASNTYYLCRNLVPYGLDIHLLTTSREGMPALPGITLHPLMQKWSWSELPRLLRFLKRLTPDAILLMYLGGIYNYHPMITFLPSLVRQFLPSTRFVTRFENVQCGWNAGDIGVHGRLIRKLFAEWVGPRRASYANGTLISDSTSVVLLCEYHLDLLRQMGELAEEKVVLIPPASNVRVIPDTDGTLRSRGRVRMGLLDEHVVLGYMGYVYPNKGVDTLLRAFSIMASQDKDARLIIAGGAIGVQKIGETSYFDSMRRLATELGLEGRVVWTGAFAPDDDCVPELISAADVWVLPLDKGVHLNNSSFAALAAYEKPLIVSKGPFLETPLVHRENVYLCSPSDPAKLANAMETVAYDPSLQNTLKRGVRSLSHEWFSWPAVLERTIEVLQGSHGNGIPK